MGKSLVGRHLVVLGAVLALGACQEGTEPFAFLKSAPEGEAVAAPAATSARLVERDVEAPKVFSANEDGLWDGRPSLGGVWVAHPGVKDPERVIIRNTTTGKFVIGALFRRERENPGPRLQVSSDAASALGMLAGAPAKLTVVALRREEAPEETAAPLVTDPVIAAPEAISAAPIGAKPAAKPAPKPAADVAASASAAIAAATPAATQPAAPKAAAAKPAAAGGKMYVQIGIFSVEANAKRAADQMAKAGISTAIRTEQSQGKTFWRVIAGPAASATERDALSQKIKGLGYPDAYAVSK